MVWQREAITIDETIWDSRSKDPGQVRRRGNSEMTNKTQTDRCLAGLCCEGHKLKKKEKGHLDCPKVKMMGPI